jgi:sortase A
MRTHGKAPGFWLRRVELALLLLGTALLLFYGIARLERTMASRKAIRTFKALQPKPAEPEEPLNRASDLPADRLPSSTSGSTIPASFDNPMAVLKIPKLDLAVPVLDGVDAVTLNHAVGHIPGTARPGEGGNVGLAGHRDGFFHELNRLKAGDKVEVESNTGTDIYIVDDIKVVFPRDVYVLDPRPQPSVTLVTCYPFRFIGNAPQRYIVSASLSPETGSTTAGGTDEKQGHSTKF